MSLFACPAWHYSSTPALPEWLVRFAEGQAIESCGRFADAELDARLEAPELDKNSNYSRIPRALRGKGCPRWYRGADGVIRPTGKKHRGKNSFRRH